MPPRLPRKPVEIPERTRELARLLAPAVLDLIREEFCRDPRKRRILSQANSLQQDTTRYGFTPRGE